MKQTTPNPHLWQSWRDKEAKGELYVDPLSLCLVTDCPFCEGTGGGECSTCKERGTLTQSEYIRRFQP